MKLDFKNKLLIIEMYKKGYSRREISERLDINESTYRIFISRYKLHGDSVFKESNLGNRYSNEFKKEIIKKVVSGYSKKQTAIEYNIPGGSSTVRDWLKNRNKILYNDFIENERKSNNMKNKQGSISNVSKKEIEYLQTIKELKAKLEKSEAENEYLKKLDVLVETRLKQQQKKK